MHLLAVCAFWQVQDCGKVSEAAADRLLFVDKVDVDLLGLSGDRPVRLCRNSGRKHPAGQAHQNQGLHTMWTAGKWSVRIAGRYPKLPYSWAVWQTVDTGQ